uniref:Uncharacterized protein n=1 Tax=Brassica campestris TaxID=3711 RepID=M4FGC0_BRACM
MNLPEKMRSLVEAYKRQKIEELMKNNDDLAEEIEMEEGNGKKWWNIPDESLSVEELKRKHQGLLSYIIAYEIRLYNGREKMVMVRLLVLRDMDIVVVAKQN